MLYLFNTCVENLECVRYIILPVHTFLVNFFFVFAIISHVCFFTHIDQYGIRPLFSYAYEWSWKLPVRYWQSKKKKTVDVKLIIF